MVYILKRSENSWRITVSSGYDSNGKKLRKYKTVTLDPKLTDRQKQKKLNELAVMFEKKCRTGPILMAKK